jgi:hypothetical protein
LAKAKDQAGERLPKGASAAVQATAVRLVQTKGPQVLLDLAKCHFKVTDEVLAKAGTDRSVLGPDGAVRSRVFVRRAHAPRQPAPSAGDTET